MAIFRKYQLIANKRTQYNQVVLEFSVRHNDNELYALASTIELLFPNKTIDEAKRILESKIGENIDVNTFSITAKDLTNGVYKHLIPKNTYGYAQVVKEIKVASVKDFEEEVRSRKIMFAFSALNDNLIGVRQDNNNHDIIDDAGKIFGLLSFLKYDAASSVERSSSRDFNMGDPDKYSIQNAVIKYYQGINGRYNAKLQHLFD